MSDTPAIARLRAQLVKCQTKIDHYNSVYEYKSKLPVAQVHLDEIKQYIKVEEDNISAIKAQIVELGGEA